MKTPKRQLAIQGFKYRHDSQIPVEISKATDRHLTRQEWRDGRETCAWNLGEYVSLRQTKMEPATWAEEQRSQGNRKLSVYQQTRASETSIM